MAKEITTAQIEQAERLATLLLSSIRGALSPAEQEELSQLCASNPAYRGLYDDAHDRKTREKWLDQYKAIQGEDDALRRVLLDNDIMPVKPRRVLLRRTWVIAAACLGLIVGGSSLWFYFQHNQAAISPLVAMQNNNDVAPGSSKATLTLSDGRTITLDSNSSNGILATQASVKVLKSAGDLVDYHSASSGAGELVYNTMSTPKGGTFRLKLSDGTKVWLNAGSSLHYPVSFTGLKERRVELSGEGYFEVADNKSVPFYVSINAGKTAIRVLGTHFNVMAYSDENRLETTLLEGAVAVGELTLHPGQQARINKDGVLSIASVDAEDYIAWKNGLIQMHDADVPTVMREISRWYDVKIQYPGGTHFSTIEMEGRVPRTLTLAQVLKVMELNGIHCKLEGRTITVIQ